MVGRGGVRRRVEERGGDEGWGDRWSNGWGPSGVRKDYVGNRSKSCFCKKLFFIYIFCYTTPP